MLARALLATMTAAALSGGLAVGAERTAPSPIVPSADNPVAPEIADGSAQSALDTARARWKARGPRSYRLEVSRSCFCASGGELRKVTVGGGKLQRDVPADVAPAATVPRQFRLVQRSIDDRVSGLGVRYGKRGNPVSIAIDPIALAVDEETSYRTHRLVRIGRR